MNASYAGSFCLEGGGIMNKLALLGFLGSLLLALAACTGLEPGGRSGSVAMEPYVDEQSGLQGLAPAYGWPEGSGLVQQSFPGTWDEFVAELSAATDLEVLPTSTASYQGRVLLWDLYSFETSIKEVGPEVYRVELGLAEGDGACYMVALIAPPEDYAANPRLYDTVFGHALYALAPLD
jgi:hypothetical protein